MGKNNIYTKEERLKKINAICNNLHGKCLSSEYIGAEHKLKFICCNGHIFEKRAREVLKGEWCKKCARMRASKNNRISYEIIKEIVEKRKGVLISTKNDYLNNSGRIDIVCDNKHNFYIKWGSLRKGGWCKKCGARRAGDIMSLNIKVPQELASSRGGKLISTKYTNSQTHLLWQCSARHIFTAIYLSVKRGTWCKKCSYFGSISERIVRMYCESLLKISCPVGRPEWLINDDGNNMSFDGFNKEYNFAFEHHGTQHYKKTKFYEGDKFKKRQRDDKTKEELAIKNNINLLIVNQLFIETNLIELRKTIIDFAKKYNLPIIENAENIDININIIYRIDPMEKYRTICENKNGILISKIYEGFKSTVLVQCNKHGIFKSRPSNLDRGNWCNKCNMARFDKSNSSQEAKKESDP